MTGVVTLSITFSFVSVTFDILARRLVYLHCPTLLCEHSLFFEPFLYLARLTTMTEHATPKDTLTETPIPFDVMSMVLNLPDVTAATKLILIDILLRHQGRIVTKARLQRDVNVAWPTVERAITDLDACGILRIERHKPERNEPSLAPRYTINLDRIRELANPHKVERVWPYEAPVNGEVPDSHYPHLGV